MSDDDQIPERPVVPYAVDFTPPAMAGAASPLTEDQVLPWCLETVDQLKSKQQLQAAIEATAFAHIGGKKAAENRRDMANHVVQALGNYGLMESDGDAVALTDLGRSLLEAAPDVRDALFARHLITKCNGQRVLDEIRLWELRGEQVRLEDLATKYDRHPTSKSISTMRAWLARAGVMPRKGAYRVNEVALAEVLGEKTREIHGLKRAELEFLLAVRVVMHQTGKAVVKAPEAARVAESRCPGLRLPRKALGSFVKRLVAGGWLKDSKVSGKGGSRHAVELLPDALTLADDELRALYEQSDLAFPLHDLDPLADVLRDVSVGNPYELGIAGEKLAVHVCLMLGLRVVSWRKRAPEAEIDLLAERFAALSYQRWAIQAKNHGPTAVVRSDRVDREVGAAAGTGQTHILILSPRAKLTRSAKLELRHRTRLTGIHVYYLDADAFGGDVDVPFEPDAHVDVTAGRLLDVLEAQGQVLQHDLQHEARRREDGA